MKTKQTLFAIVIASALAACATNDEELAQPAATGDKPVTASPTPQQGQPSGSSVGDDTAGAFWTEHARGGYMTKEQATGYKSTDGKSMDWTKLDANGDGRVSQEEWNNYHGAAGAAGRPAK